MLATIENLREISHRCLTDQPLSPEQSQWLGVSFTSFLDHRSRSLDEALGLRFPRGGVPWWREEAIRNRDAALRALAAEFLEELSPCAQAARIWTLATRYGATAWRYDREREEMPAQYHGTPKQYLWSAFSSGATMPICRRQLRKILAR